VLVANEEVGSFVELTALDAATFVLHIAELIDGFLELAGEARAVEAKRGELGDEGLRVGVLHEQFSFDEWDAVEAPGGVGDFVGELRLGGRGGAYSSRNCWMWRW
jgi:hypothetical protein